MNMGAKLYFQDEDGGLLWLPGRKAGKIPGVYMGGQAIHARQRGVPIINGTDQDILGTGASCLARAKKCRPLIG